MSGPKGPESGDVGLCSIIPRSEIVHIPGIGEMTIHIETLFPVTDRPDKVAIEVVRTGESGLVRWSTGRYVSVDNDPFACFFPLDPSVMDHYDHVELGMLLPALQQKLKYYGCDIDFSKGFSGHGFAYGNPRQSPHSGWNYA